MHSLFFPTNKTNVLTRCTVTTQDFVKTGLICKFNYMYNKTVTTENCVRDCQTQLKGCLKNYISTKLDWLHNVSTSRLQRHFKSFTRPYSHLFNSLLLNLQLQIVPKEKIKIRFILIILLFIQELWIFITLTWFFALIYLQLISTSTYIKIKALYYNFDIFSCIVDECIQWKWVKVVGIWIALVSIFQLYYCGLFY